MVHGYDRIYVERGGRIYTVEAGFTDEATVELIAGIVAVIVIAIVIFRRTPSPPVSGAPWPPKPPDRRRHRSLSQARMATVAVRYRWSLPNPGPVDIAVAARFVPVSR